MKKLLNPVAWLSITLMFLSSFTSSTKTTITSKMWMTVEVGNNRIWCTKDESSTIIIDEPAKTIQVTSTAGNAGTYSIMHTIVAKNGDVTYEVTGPNEVETFIINNFVECHYHNSNFYTAFSLITKNP